jgi:TIR domain-containing protein
MASRLFLCYARDDHKWAELLRDHIAPLQEANYLSAFVDRQLQPGAPWDSEIKNELEKADLIVAIVTAALLSSRYAVHVELATAFKRYRAGNVKIIPIIADYCDWEPTELGQLQALPPGNDGRILPLVDWSNPHVPLTSVAKALRSIVGQTTTSSQMPSPAPDRSRSQDARTDPRADPATGTAADTRIVSARSVEMLDVAFASASTLLDRCVTPAMWVDELHQSITMTVRVDRDWSVRYEKEVHMSVSGAGAIMAAPFKITAQPEVMSRLTLFDVDARYLEIDSDAQPLMFPALIQGTERGFAVIFTPPISAARIRKFRTWFAVDREFAATLGSGGADQLTCATLQLARAHRAELTFRVLLHSNLRALSVVPQFDCVQVADGKPSAGFGEPYKLYEYRAEAHAVEGKLAQRIELTAR